MGCDCINSLSLPFFFHNIMERTGIDFSSTTRSAEERSRWKRVVKSTVVSQQPCLE